MEDKQMNETEWNPDEMKAKMADANDFIERAGDESDKANYRESEKLLLKVLEIEESE